MNSIRHFLAAAAAIALSCIAPPRAVAQTPAPGGGYPADFFPPRNASFDGAGPATYPPGVIVRNVSFSSPNTTRMSPAAGQNVVVNFNMTFSAETSTNGGVSFSRVTAPAVAALRNTHAGPVANGGTLYNTEMLQLNISGGNLGAGVMVRESPTRASLGQTTITSAGGGYFGIDSFFDIFTELSFDGGQNWSPNSGTALRVTMRRLGPESVFPTDFHPPPGRYDQAPASGDVAFGNGVVLRSLSHRRVSPGRVPSVAGVADHPLQDDIAFLISTDGGNIFTAVTAPVIGVARFTPTPGLVAVPVPGGGTSSSFDTEMLSLNISGGGLPPNIRIRESPTRASTGKHKSRTVEGGYMIDSFFDIFTEISLNGGQTWVPAQGQPVRMECGLKTRKAGALTNFYPPGNSELGVPPGLRFRSVCSPNGTQTRRWRIRNPHSFPLNLAGVIGVAQNSTTTADFDFEVSHDNGATWSPVTESVTLAIRATRRAGNGSTTGTFDTEMLSLTPAGGGAIRVRESPTRASTGRIVMDTVQEAIESFFDVFTEVSIDGGQTWSPADGPARMDLNSIAPAEFYPSNFVPLTGITAMDDWESPVAFSGAAISVGVKVYSTGGTSYNNRALPPPGTNGFMDYTDDACIVSITDNAGVVTDYTATAMVNASLGDSNGDSIYDTEMLQLNISGGTLPAGTMIRESPTRASTGRMTVAPVDGGFRIGSFFDVFTEVSLDGGQNWHPAVEPMHMEGSRRDPLTTFCFSLNLPSHGELELLPGGRRPRTTGGTSVSEFRVQPASGSPQIPPPAAGTPVVVESSHTIGWNTINDLGVTARHRQTGNIVVQYTLSDSTADGTRYYDTEMLSLNLSGAGGVMLRESPTRRSTGKTLVTDNNDPDGLYRIGSFFDVFTELSLDGGQTWMPTDIPLHLELLPAVQKVTLAAATLPQAATVSNAADRGRSYPDGGGTGRVMMQSFNFLRTGAPTPLPAPGANATADLDADGRLDLVLADGTSVGGDCRFGHVVLIGHDFDEANGTRHFVTEMLSLNVSGGTLPPNIMIRESPTLPSKGRTTSRALPNGTWRTDSFFDVFTELSLDGGQTWLPSDGPMRLEAAPVAPPVVAASLHYAATDFLPPPGAIHIGDLQFPGGITLQNVRLVPSPTTPRFPPPAPGVTADGRSLSVELFFDTYEQATGKTTSHSAPALVDLRFTGAPPGSDRFYDTEMLSLTITGAPGGIMIRESPTLPSTGGTRIIDAPGGGFMVDSFFDVFFEISLDGGSLWLPSLAVGRAVLEPQPPVERVPTAFFPPRNAQFTTRRNDGPLLFGNVGRISATDSFHLNGAEYPAIGLLYNCNGAVDLQAMAVGSSTTLNVTGRSTLGFSFGVENPTTIGSVTSATIGVTRRDNETWDIEMLSLNLNGPNFRLRESPTKASLGRTSIRQLPDGFYQIESFFDVFVELSVDGGQTWTPADRPISVDQKLGMPDYFHASDFVPVPTHLEGDPDQPVVLGRVYSVRCKEILPSVSDVSREPAPSAGQTRQITVIQDMVFDFSTDGGLTFTPVTTAATVTTSITNNGGGGGGTRSFDTEMLQLNIQGGTLPAGVMIRESPTRASTGKTSIRAAAGGFRIGSFFDVFIELTVDGGRTWMPAADTMHLENIANSRPVIVGAPPDLGTDGGDWGAGTTANAVGIEELTLVYEGFLAPALPPAGVVTTTTTPYELAIMWRQEFGPVQPQRHRALVTVRLTPRDGAGPGTPLSFDTEMLSMNLQGTAPAAGGLMIRESPTRASTGRSTYTPLPGGGYSIDSFFDVFTELSIDGGQTWMATDMPLHLTAHPPVPKVTMPSPTPPPVLTESESSSFRGLVYTEGDFVSFILISAQTGFGPLPGAGQQQSFALDGSAALASPLFNYRSSQVNTQLAQFRIRDTGGSGPTRFYDTEMLALDISGGGLPAGFMIRESPTLASVGRMTSTTLPNGTYRIGSFFDVFTELSLDGGQTWRPSDGPVRLNMTHPQRSIVTGLDNNAPPVVTLSTPGRLVTHTFLAFPESFRGGVRVAVGDVNGDGTDEIFTGAGPGAAAHVKVFDGAGGSTIRSFFAYNGFTGGVYVAAGDVNGDGLADIITGTGAGASHVKVFDGRSLTELRSFLPYGAFTGGVRVAAGDVNGDGRADIITGAGPGASGGHVKVFDGLTGAELRSFFAYAGFAGGVHVAAGDVDGDGRADIITGADAGGGPHVKVFDDTEGAESLSFFAYSPSFSGGVRVAAGDVNGDGLADIITGTGAGAPGGHVKVFSGSNGSEMSSFLAQDPSFNSGIFVAGTPRRSPNATPSDADGDGLSDEWEIAHWRTTEGRDGMDDSDQDGIPAVAELGFGLDPDKPDISGLPPAIVENGFLTMTIPKRPGAVYEVQSGDSLDPFAFGTWDTTVLMNDLTTLKVRDNKPFRDASRRFMRAVVTGAP